MVYFITLSCIYKNHKVNHFNYILLLYNDTNKQNLVPRPATLNKGQKARLIMTVKEGIQFMDINTMRIRGEDTTMLFKSKQINETEFNSGLKIRDNMTIILNDDLVEGVKIKMKFGKERLYVMIKDDLFGVIINDLYTY